jgi:hypothetical protein
VPLAVLTGLLAVGLAVLLSMLTDRVSDAPATLTLVGVVAALTYAVTALRAAPMVRWAVTRTLGSLRQLLPMVTRALPLLLVFVTFLFINAEVWHVSANLDGGRLWLTVLLFTTLGIGFFLVRIPEEIDRADDDLDDARIVAVTAGTPLGEEAARLVAEGRHPPSRQVQVSGFERVNLIVAMLVTQLGQVLLIALTLLAFFLLLGGIAMDEQVVEAWIGEQSTAPGWLPNLSVELLQVSVFLAAFSGLYFIVTAITDETYRQEFLTALIRDLERAVALRAVYAALAEERSAAPGKPAEDPSPTVPMAWTPHDRPE